MKASASLLYPPLKLVIRDHVAPFAYRLGLLFRESNPPGGRSEKWRGNHSRTTLPPGLPIRHSNSARGYKRESPRR